VRTGRRSSLSLNEWAVLACLVERPRHGYEIARELDPEAEIGGVWRVPRQVVYRALDRLVALDLARPGGVEDGEGGPPRQVHAATADGRDRLGRWLAEPVAHLRDVRSALLLKLVVARRLAVDVSPLVGAQQARFAASLDALAQPPPPDDPVALWRHHSAIAVQALLADLAEAVPAARSPARPVVPQR
jgi:DNA-binding PadR family transcriptional regulator